LGQYIRQKILCEAAKNNASESVEEGIPIDVLLIDKKVMGGI
jgi:hypothetical protein